jgi:hypothetical protein
VGHLAPLPKDAAVRAANRAENEHKKEKDDGKKKKKARTWLDQGKWRQGSEEEEDDETDDEEEEEKEAYGSALPIPWEDLVDKEEPAGGDASLAGPFPFHEREDAPLEPTVVGHSALSEPSEQREGSKRPRADEAQPGSGKPALKRHRPVAPR